MGAAALAFELLYDSDRNYIRAMSLFQWIADIKHLDHRRELRTRKAIVILPRTDRSWMIQDLLPNDKRAISITQAAEPFDLEPSGA